jgi:hypothetical protein
LLKQDWPEARVEAFESLLLGNTSKSSRETICESGLGDKADTGSLKRAKDDISEKLSDTRRSEINRLSVVTSSIDANSINERLFPELVTPEFEGTLESISKDRGPEAGKKCAGTLVCDHLPETANHTLGGTNVNQTIIKLGSLTHLVVDLGLELNARLYDVNRGQCTMGDCTTNTTSESKAGVEIDSCRGLKFDISQSWVGVGIGLAHLVALGDGGIAYPELCANCPVHDAALRQGHSIW